MFTLSGHSEFAVIALVQMLSSDLVLLPFLSAFDLDIIVNFNYKNYPNAYVNFHATRVFYVN